MLADRLADLDPDDPRGHRRARPAAPRLRRGQGGPLQRRRGRPSRWPCRGDDLAAADPDRARGPDHLPAARHPRRHPARPALGETSTAAELAAVVLVGGSSRIPLVSHLLQSEFGVRTAMDTHPKHDIALGAVQYHPAASGEAAPAAAPTVAQWPTRGKKPGAEPTATSGPDTSGADPAHADGLGTRRTRPGANGPDTGPARGEETARPSGVEAARYRGRGAVRRHSATERSSRPTSRPVLLGIAAAVALLVVGASAYAFTRDDTIRRRGTTAESRAPPTAVRPRVPRPRSTPRTSSWWSSPMTRTAHPRCTLLDTTTGEDLGPVSPGAGSTDAAWASRDGDIVGFREAATSAWQEGPWTIQEMSRDGTVVPLFTRPPEGIECCVTRVAWHPTSDQVLLNCLQDDDGDGKFEPSLYTGPVGEDGRVDGTQLRMLLSNDSPTEDSPDGSPGSNLRGVSYLPSGDVVVVVLRGRGTGDPRGRRRRLLPQAHLRRARREPRRLPDRRADHVRTRR